MENIAAIPDISPAALQHRLNSLHLNGSATAPSTPPAEPQESVDPSSQRPHSFGPEGNPSVVVTSSPDEQTPDLSRRTSEEDPPSGVATPHPRFSEVEDLCRVPSYSTAVRSNRRTAYNGDLPDYQSATAGDASPVSAPTQQSQQARPENPRRSQTYTDLSPRMHWALHGRSHSHNDDADRRPRLLHSRART